MNAPTLAVMTTSARTATGSDTWCSPDVVLECVRAVAPIDLDPCTEPDNPTGARHFCTGPDHGGADGLTAQWFSYELSYVNAPYSLMREWAVKMAYEAQRGARILALVPVRPDTEWWRTAAGEADLVAFWNGRLKFKGAPSSAPFPSAVLAFNIGRRAMVRAFGEHAQIWSAP